MRFSYSTSLDANDTFILPNLGDWIVNYISPGGRPTDPTGLLIFKI